jgi:hypothetical protein
MGSLKMGKSCCLRQQAQPQQNKLQSQLATLLKKLQHPRLKRMPSVKQARLVSKMMGASFLIILVPTWTLLLWLATTLGAPATTEAAHLAALPKHTQTQTLCCDRDILLRL